jgi:hypothetical protein
LRKFSGYVVQQWPDLAFRKGHDPGDNPAGSLGGLRSERAQKNAGLVRSEDRGRAVDVYRGGHHGVAIPERRDRKPWLLKMVIGFGIETLGCSDQKVIASDHTAAGIPRNLVMHAYGRRSGREPAAFLLVPSHVFLRIKGNPR